MTFKKKSESGELEQQDRRQNLEFIGVPSCNNKNVTQIVLDLIESFNLIIVAENISIAHRLPLSKDHPPKKTNSTLPSL